MPRKKSATIDLKVRMKEPLRRRIEKSAKGRGVSLNAEAVARLEQSFQKGDFTIESLGGPRRHALFLLLSAAADMIEFPTGKSFLDDFPTALAVQGAWSNLIAGALPGIPQETKQAIEKLPPRATEKEMGDWIERNFPIVKMFQDVDLKKTQAVKFLTLAELLRNDPPTGQEDAKDDAEVHKTDAARDTPT